MAIFIKEFLKRPHERNKKRVAMLATFVAPVFAAEKISATFIPSAVSTTGGTVNLTPSGIRHVNGAVRTATATLIIGTVVYTGSVRVDLDYIVNPIKGTTTQHYHKMTMTFPVQTGLAQEGTFEGVLTWTAELANPIATLAGHAVLQGAGAFEGQTLKLSNMHTGGPFTGWLLTH